MQLPKTPRGQKFKEKKCQYPGTFSIVPSIKRNEMVLKIVFDTVNNDQETNNQLVGDVLEKLSEVKFPCCCTKFDFGEEKTVLRFIYHSDFEIVNGQEILNIVGNKLMKSNIVFSDISLEVGDEEKEEKI